MIVVITLLHIYTLDEYAGKAVAEMVIYYYCRAAEGPYRMGTPILVDGRLFQYYTESDRLLCLVFDVAETARQRYSTPPPLPPPPS